MKEGRKRTVERNPEPREAINSPFVSKFSPSYTRASPTRTHVSPTRAQGGYINSLCRIRIGPFQTSGGWRTRMGGGGGVVWCGVVWCGVGPVSEVGRAGRRVGGTFLDQ